MINGHGIRMAASSAREDPAWLKLSLITIALMIVGLLIGVPVIHVFWQALSGGIKAYISNIFEDPANRDAIFTTLYVAPRAVFLNLLFGISSAWLVSRFKFPGRTILLTLIDMPFAISPVVVGLGLVLLYGSSGLLGPSLASVGIQVLFNSPALVLATTFVTLPFIVRELIPVMESIGPDEELAALSLGASGFQIFFRITLPSLTLGLLYGTILCTARAVGEFGAIYVVSGRIAGRGQTIPLRVEQLFQQYQTPADFALASILTVIALATLLARKIMQSLSNQRHATDQAKRIPA
ncbi:MAG: sulfate ABC transporter permease subunit [Planctomycetota bacterium]